MSGRKAARSRPGGPAARPDGNRWRCLGVRYGLRQWKAPRADARWMASLGHAAVPRGSGRVTRGGEKMMGSCKDHPLWFSGPAQERISGHLAQSPLYSWRLHVQELGGGSVTTYP